MSGIASYDAWSAFSMSYNNGESRAPPPLAIPDAQLLPFPEKKKRRRITAKRAEAPADDVDKQAISAGGVRCLVDGEDGILLHPSHGTPPLATLLRSRFTHGIDLVKTLADSSDGQTGKQLEEGFNTISSELKCSVKKVYATDE